VYAAGILVGVGCSFGDLGASHQRTAPDFRAAAAAIVAAPAAITVLGQP